MLALDDVVTTCEHCAMTNEEGIMTLDKGDISHIML
jgi:hypothetical protein